jgi:hypothetical protein
MKDKAGITLVWAFYLGMVRVVGREVLPFVLYICGVVLLFCLLLRHLMQRRVL